MKKILCLIATALIFTVASASEPLLDGATFRVQFNETSAEQLPADMVSGKKLVVAPKSTQPQSVNDQQMGYVREFTSNQTILRPAKPITVCGTSERTIAFWVYVDNKFTAPNGNEMLQQNAQIVLMGSAVGELGLLNIAIFRGTPRLLFQTGATHIADFKEYTTSMLGAWHHMAIVLPEGGDVTKIRCYVDGQDCGAASTVDSKGNSIAPFTYNTNKAPANFGHSFSGRLSEFVMFDRELSPKEIKKLMTLTK